MGYPASAMGPRLPAYDIVQARSIGLADSPLSIAARREFPDSDVVVMRVDAASPPIPANIAAPAHTASAGGRCDF